MMKEILPQAERSRRGFSLAEVAIVLGIVGIVLGSIWSYSAAMQETVRQERFSDVLTHIVDNIRGVYTGRTSFENTSAKQMMLKLTERGVFPSDTLRRRGTLTVPVSPFGEYNNPRSLTYKSLYVCGWSATSTKWCDFADSTDGSFPLFAVEVLLPKSSCITAAVRNSNSVSHPGLVGIHINDGASLTLPLTLKTAGEACTKSVNNVDFVFKLVP